MENQAAEAGLDVACRAAESIVKIEVPEGSFDIISPEQAHNSTTEPNAFGIAGRAGDHTLGFGVLVELVQLVLGGRSGLVGRLPIGSLREG
jgi:hypothetical protein